MSHISMGAASCQQCPQHGLIVRQHFMYTSVLICTTNKQIYFKGAWYGVCPQPWHCDQRNIACPSKGQGLWQGKVYWDNRIPTWKFQVSVYLKVYVPINQKMLLFPWPDSSAVSMGTHARGSCDQFVCQVCFICLFGGISMQCYIEHLWIL